MKKIIAVDLDETLSLTDTFYEVLIIYLKSNPLKLFFLLFWILKGKAYLKEKLAQNIKFEPDSILYNKEIINWLIENKKLGYKIVLCTGSNIIIAKKIAAHLNIFDDIIASDSKINLVDINKRKVLDDKFGYKNYDYVGDSFKDLIVWSGSDKVIVNNPSKSLLKEINKVSKNLKIFYNKNFSFLSFIRIFRIHQWLKNILIFYPFFYLINMIIFI